jgi:hypothetical protein
MAIHKCIINVRVVVDPSRVVPPDVLAGEFPGWDSWNGGEASRKALQEFVARRLAIYAMPEGLYEPEVVESPKDDSDLFQLRLISVDENLTFTAQIPFGFTRKVAPEDLDPSSDFTDECGDIGGIFCVDWQTGEGIYEGELAFMESELFSVTMEPSPRKRGS